MKIRYLSHPFFKGKFNMAVDEAIHNACQRGEVGPTLRFYRWNPACLSLGRFQDVAREIDLQRLKAFNFDIVRRATGGKSVLHDDELTYSLVISEKLMSGSILETYKKISQALVCGLQNLGLPAKLTALERGVTSRDSRFKQPACFSAPSWYEITAHGKKIIGSAQVRRGGVILQHGSIPLYIDFSKTVSCLKTRTDMHAKRIKSLLSKKAAGLRQIYDADISYDRLEKAMVTAFETTFGWVLRKGCLTPTEIQESVELCQNKYGSNLWTMTRTGKAVCDVK